MCNLRYLRANFLCGVDVLRQFGNTARGLSVRIFWQFWIALPQIGQRVHTAKNTDLDPLRNREDFKKLLADLEKKAAAQAEKKP